MAAEPSNYHRGEMDIHEQRRTYHSFLVLSKWGALAIIVGVLFFALLFAVGVGFIGAFVTAKHNGVFRSPDLSLRGTAWLLLSPYSKSIWVTRAGWL
jgi:hypothetical protein